MTDSVRWGILATGGIAHLFARDLVAHGHIVSAVGSRTLDSAQLFAAEFDIPQAHGSYADLVADPEVDIVYIASPHPFHAEHAEQALNAGKHVLIEKPMTLNASEARHITTIAAQKKLLLMEAMWTRYLPHMVQIRKIIADGVIGSVSALLADHSQNLTDDPKHRINARELGGGALLDLGIYPISFAADLFGIPESVQAAAVFGATRVDTQVVVNMRYEAVQIASTYSTSRSRGPNTASVLGSAGRIDIDSVWYAPTSFRVINPVGEVLEEFDEAVSGRGMQFQADEAERLIAEGRTESDILSPAASVAIMETLDEVRRQIGLVYPGE